jgi:hypothetical protein
MLEAGGAPAPGKSRLTSPNRRFSVVASDEGLLLRGPASSVAIGSDSVVLSSGADARLELAPGTADLRADTGALAFSATGSLTAPLVTLGGRSGCRPAARLGDGVRAGGEAGAGTITGGSPVVLAC